jgi:hypothetical protein
MVATTEPRVEIDDRIRANPDLLQSVTATMAYLGRTVSGVPLPASIRWRFLPLDPGSIELLLSDSTDFTDPVVRRVFRVTDLNDEYAREVGILRTFGDLLQIRSKNHMAHIDELIRAIDFDAYHKDLNRVLAGPREEQP